MRVLPAALIVKAVTAGALAFAIASGLVVAQGSTGVQVLNTNDPERVVLAGCVERVDALLSGPARAGGPGPDHAGSTAPGPAAPVTPGAARVDSPAPAVAKSSAALSTFMLTHANVVATGEGTRAGGAAGSLDRRTGPHETSRAVSLLARPGVNLAPHVGHRVEVTGTIARTAVAASQEMAAGAPDSNARDTMPADPREPKSPSVPGTAHDVSSAPVVTVTSVRMTSASCP